MRKTKTTDMMDGSFLLLQLGKWQHHQTKDWLMLKWEMNRMCGLLGRGTVILLFVASFVGLFQRRSVWIYVLEYFPLKTNVRSNESRARVRKEQLPINSIYIYDMWFWVFEFYFRKLLRRKSPFHSQWTQWRNLLDILLNHRIWLVYRISFLYFSPIFVRYIVCNETHLVSAICHHHLWLINDDTPLLYLLGWSSSQQRWLWSSESWRIYPLQIPSHSAFLSTCWKRDNPKNYIHHTLAM